MLKYCKLHIIHYKDGAIATNKWHTFETQKELIGKMSIITLWQEMHYNEHFDIELLFYNEINKVEYCFIGAI